ncbi:hypothetical protein FACS1894200_00260 [Spirochaetia bacterium]|nr:hypothetical protein FACS1894200_00260 [Spirochaetia bacterium]
MPGFETQETAVSEIARPDQKEDVYKPSESASSPSSWGEAGGIAESDKERATEIVDKACDFIQEHAETPQEREVADKISVLMENGKIEIADTGDILGYPVYGFYDPSTDTICLDINAVLDYGTAETIDTLIHEGYHAAQHDEGHRNDIVVEETHAWNVGLEMSNEYRDEVGETKNRTEQYTQVDIKDMGYHDIFGFGQFTELAGHSDNSNTELV